MFESNRKCLVTIYPFICLTGTIYNSAHTKLNYNTGDSIGIKIHKVDRTNTESDLLPYKILQVKVINDSNSNL